MARILVIDDDAGLRQMIKLMLEREGHQAVLAENGQTGLQSAMSELPDVAIIDLMMPGLSGYDVTRQLRADPRTAKLPVLVLTARNQPMDRQMALGVGANAFMSKPVSSRDLHARLNEILSGQVASATPGQLPAAPPTAAPPMPNASTS